MRETPELQLAGTCGAAAAVRGAAVGVPSAGGTRAVIAGGPGVRPAIVLAGPCAQTGAPSRVFSARRAHALALLTLLTACDGNLTGGRPVVRPGLLEDGGCAPVNRNDEVRLALAAACAGCHMAGSKPYWASLTAFETLIYDPVFVVRGDPDASHLIKLFKGTATGTFTQMPPGELYSETVSRGDSTMTIEQLEQWVRELPPRGDVVGAPQPERYTVRRLSAEEMVVSAMSQLGLTLEDFVDTTSASWRDQEYTVRGGRFFIWPKDWAPGISRQYVSDSRTVERYEALGGMAALDNRGRDSSLGPAAVQTLVQMSQAWCRAAVSKPGNTAVLRYVTLADRSTTKAADIKRNIASLHLRMLAEPATEKTVDELYTRVYLPAETTNTRAAWTAVCASFMRHPLWLSY